jgi:hypothetical protein
MKTLDNFFTDMMSELQEGLLSNCCAAEASAETFLNVGRCSDCLEMATFSQEDLDG